MVGYLKCILINSHKPGHDDTPTSSDVTDEPSPNKDIELVKGHIKRDYLKEYAFSLSNEQGILPSKQQYLESIEVLFRESAKGGGMYVCLQIHMLRFLININGENCIRILCL